MKRRMLAVAVVLTTVTAREASGDIYHLKTPSTVTTEGGSTLKLPPGFFLDEKAWLKRDLEMKRLQGQEIRLGAENKSLRKSASSSTPMWFTTLTFAVGAFTGFVTYQIVK